MTEETRIVYGVCVDDNELVKDIMDDIDGDNCPDKIDYTMLSDELTHCFYHSECHFGGIEGVYGKFDPSKIRITSEEKRVMNRFCRKYHLAEPSFLLIQITD